MTRTETVSRTATLADPNNLLSLTTAGTTRVVNGRTYETTFDPTTRTYTTITPASRTMVTTLDTHGRTASTQLAALAANLFSHDNRGRLLTAGPTMRTTQFGYDDTSGFLTSVTDPLAQATQLQPDLIGRTTRITYPDTNFTLLGYDGDSNLTGSRHRASRSTHKSSAASPFSRRTGRPLSQGVALLRPATPTTLIELSAT